MVRLSHTQLVSWDTDNGEVTDVVLTLPVDKWYVASYVESPGIWGMGDTPDEALAQARAAMAAAS